MLMNAKTVVLILWLLYVDMWVILQRITYDCVTPLNLLVLFFTVQLFLMWGLIKYMDS